MKRDKTYRSFTLPLLLLALLSLFSNCQNDLNKISQFNPESDTIPGEYMLDAEMLYSELGFLKMKLTSPRVINVTDEEEPYQKMPEGFLVEFYNDSLEIETTISADYGINYTQRKLMEARGNVVVTSFVNNERLDTEELFWDQNKHIIFSNVFVKITTDDRVLYGEGLEADENFKKRTLKKVHGEIDINKTEL